MLSLREIHDGLAANLQALDDLVKEAQDAGHNAAITENAYKVGYAKARITIRATATDKLTVEQVEAEATVATRDEQLAFLLAQNQLTIVRESLRATQSKVDAYRTLAASFRNAGG